MALATTTLVRARAAVAVAGTAVSASVETPDNCHTIMFLNRSANLIIISQGPLPAGPLPDNGTTTVIPANATLTPQLIKSW